MKVCRKIHVKWVSFLVSILALTLFLVACGSSGGSTTTTPAPTPTPTSTGVTYTGNGYTLTYPAGWTQSGPQSLAVFTNNSDPDATFTVTVTPKTILTNQTTELDAAIRALKNNANFTQTNTTTTSIGGDSWKEQDATFNQNGQNVKAAIIADEHSNNVFVITLKDKAGSYDQTNSTAFQPMLNSFKFTS